jgi:heat-inducible transcriptional repressor
MERLSERQEIILALVVREHVATAQPVSSKALYERYNLSISPATIRNEMANLETRGYLTHPHTSAGRLPTEEGYRYFVQRLMEEVELSAAERRTIRHQFHQARLELDQWLLLSAAVLGRTMQSAALVTAPKATCCRVKHLELVAIHAELSLLILVLQGGMVKQQPLPPTLDSPMSQGELSIVANRLTYLWAGLNVDEIRTMPMPLTPFEQQVAEAVWGIMNRIDAQPSSDIYHYGLTNILRQPEFSSTELVSQVIQALEERALIEALVSEVLSRGGVQIIIGGEGRWQALSECSVVLARYGIDDEASGALGIVGPMRLPYGRAVSVVRYIAELMTDLVEDIYGC